MFYFTFKYAHSNERFDQFELDTNHYGLDQKNFFKNYIFKDSNIVNIPSLLTLRVNTQAKLCNFEEIFESEKFGKWRFFASILEVIIIRFFL